MRSKRELKQARPTKSLNTYKPDALNEKSAGAVVFYPGPLREYLLVFSTYWEFPKGLVEAGESEEAGALREVREETGLDVDLVPGLREVISYVYRRNGRLIRKEVVYFLGRASERQVSVSWEHHEARWLAYAQAMELLKYENAREVLRKANDLLDRNLGGGPDENPGN